MGGRRKRRLTAGVPTTHKCRRPHGHRYRMWITVAGGLDADGMVIEYGILDKIVKPIWALCDHHDLNTLDQRCSARPAKDVAANPTVERFVHWWVFRIQSLIRSSRQGELRLERLRIEEDSESCCEWAAAAE
jgi:6-pyruvoyl-tetrahydropterin synthase